jgi:hypothetical protein
MVVPTQRLLEGAWLPVGSPKVIDGVAVTLFNGGVADGAAPRFLGSTRYGVLPGSNPSTSVSARRSARSRDETGLMR